MPPRRQIESGGWVHGYSILKGLFRSHPTRLRSESQEQTAISTSSTSSSTRRSAAKATHGQPYSLPHISIGSSINVDTSVGDTATTSRVQLNGSSEVSFDWDGDVPEFPTGSFVRRDSSGNIVSGTLPGLTELLLDFDNNDISSKNAYQKVFICCHKSFEISSQKLLSLLLYQCGTKLRSVTVEQQIALYYSLRGLLEIWMDVNMHEYVVEELPFLYRMKEVAGFLHSKIKTHRSETLIHMIDEYCDRVLAPSPEPQQYQPVLADLSTTSTEVSQKMLSNALKAVFSENYKTIKQGHYIEYIYSNRDNPVAYFLRNCRKIEFWVKKAILRPHSHAERTSILEYFLIAVKECRQSGNYACARAMIHGILHFAKMMRTFGNLNKKMLQILKEEEASIGDYENIIDRLDHCIPCLEVHVKNMKTRLAAASHGFREGRSFINFEGCREVYACISKLPKPPPLLSTGVNNYQGKRAIELVLAQLHNITVDDRLVNWIRRRSDILQKEELLDYQARWHELRNVGFEPTHIRPVQQVDHPFGNSAVPDVTHASPPYMNPFDRHSPMCLDGQITNVSSRPVDGGGNADIYTGEYRGQQVAIKSLRLWSSDSTRISETRLLNRIRREYTAWTWVSHPLVLPCLGYFFFDTNRDLPALVSPWMANGSFENYARRLSGLDCLKVLVEIAEGLCYLHEYYQPIVHGDIRAANILISDDGRPCLSDFGLSSVLREEGFTKGSAHAGSLCWMSPELLQQQQGVSATPTTYSDTWAYAMTVLEVMTGKRPYSPIESPVTIIEMICQNMLPPKPNSMKVPKSLSAKIWSLCQKCWVAQPHERLTMSQVYQTVRSFR